MPPAILSMAYWCLDKIGSANLSRPQFRVPYPKGHWYEEKQANLLFMALMPIAYKFATLGLKIGEGKKLSEEEIDDMESIWELEEKLELDNGWT